MLERIKNEPARVVAVVIATIGVASAFGLHLSEDQTAAIVALVGAVLALVGGETVRGRVRPTRKDQPPASPPAAY